MPFQQYAWAAGHGVALASLANVENDLFPYTKPLRIPPRSQPIDQFPVREMVQAGYELGDGRRDHRWDMTLPREAVDYIYDTYLSSGTVTQASMTINTREHIAGTYGRYNCYLILPKPGQDITYIRQNVFRCVLRFTALVAL